MVRLVHRWYYCKRKNRNFDFLPCGVCRQRVLFYYVLFVRLTCICRNSGVSVQDPFSDSSDPAFQKRANIPPGLMYQQGGGGMDARMQYDANKEPYGSQRKGKSV